MLPSNELAGLRHVTSEDIPFVNKLIGAYHCPPDMDVAEEEKEYFNQLIAQRFTGLYLPFREYLNSGKYPLIFHDEKLWKVEPMCFVIQYSSGQLLSDKWTQFSDNKYTEEDKYAESVRKWTLQMLASFHWLHEKYLYLGNIHDGIVIDALDNAALIGFERSASLLIKSNTTVEEQNTYIERNSKVEATMLFSMLVAHCVKQLKYNQIKITSTDNISLELCQKNWKKWNSSANVDVDLMYYVQIPIIYDHNDIDDKYYSAEQILKDVFGTTPKEVTCQYLPKHSRCREKKNDKRISLT
eukprot:GHVR01134718.1.p1 GENE.GHVR01134718.1~~GHVR01134718.1.p1  ORF type:complete len:298 (-),score=33.00 GHVR01134718.1:178-1071(-)